MLNGKAMNLDSALTGSRPSTGAGLPVLRAAFVTAALSLCASCGAAASDEQADERPPDEGAAVSSGAEPERGGADAGSGALSIEVSFAGTMQASPVAWLSPLLTASGLNCRRACASSQASCAEECQPQWLATGATRQWPGVSHVQLEGVPPGRYWLFAHLGREVPLDPLPRPGDPVSRELPRVLEVSAGEMARLALTLDASFTRDTTAQEPPCAAPVAAALPRPELKTGDVEPRVQPRPAVRCRLDATP